MVQIGVVPGDQVAKVGREVGTVAALIVDVIRKPRTRRHLDQDHRDIAALRRFFGFLMDEGLRSDDPSAALPRPSI